MSGVRRLTIAIDGPSGAGKSTVGRAIARKMGYEFVDTGAMYRSLALHAQSQNVDWADGPALGALAQELPLVFGDATVLLAGKDVSLMIRTEGIAKGASLVSQHPEVRDGLLALQRVFGKRGGVVIDGRDIGTVVCPNADVKFFMTAAAVARAKRRFDQLEQLGQEPDLAQITQELEERDHRDSNRAISPLKQADDAVFIDTSTMNIEAVMAHCLAHVLAVQGKVIQPPDAI